MVETCGVLIETQVFTEGRKTNSSLFSSSDVDGGSVLVVSFLKHAAMKAAECGSSEFLSLLILELSFLEFPLW